MHGRSAPLRETVPQPPPTAAGPRHARGRAWRMKPRVTPLVRGAFGRRFCPWCTSRRSAASSCSPQSRPPHPARPAQARARRHLPARAQRRRSRGPRANGSKGSRCGSFSTTRYRFPPLARPSRAPPARPPRAALAPSPRLSRPPPRETPLPLRRSRDAGRVRSSGGCSWSRGTAGRRWPRPPLCRPQAPARRAHRAPRAPHGSSPRPSCLTLRARCAPPTARAPNRRFAQRSPSAAVAERGRGGGTGSGRGVGLRRVRGGRRGGRSCARRSDRGGGACHGHGERGRCHARRRGGRARPAALRL